MTKARMTPVVLACWVGTAALFVLGGILLVFGFPESNKLESILLSIAGLCFVGSLGGILAGIILRDDLWHRESRPWLIIKYVLMGGLGLSFFCFILGIFFPLTMPLSHFFAWAGISPLALYLLLNAIQQPKIRLEAARQNGTFTQEILDLDPGGGAPPQAPILESMLPPIEHVFPILDEPESAPQSKPAPNPGQQANRPRQRPTQPPADQQHRPQSTEDHLNLYRQDPPSSDSQRKVRHRPQIEPESDLESTDTHRRARRAR